MTPARRKVTDPDRRRLLKQKFAADLRNSATDAERKLWSMLRRKQFAGLRFRRQQPVGRYILDFYCSAAKLVIELDGGQHSEDRRVAYDEVRTRWLSEHGYRVLRFSNSEFLKNPEIVFDGIWDALKGCVGPLPKPPSAV